MEWLNQSPDVNQKTVEDLWRELKIRRKQCPLLDQQEVLLSWEKKDLKYSPSSETLICPFEGKSASSELTGSDDFSPLYQKYFKLNGDDGDVFSEQSTIVFDLNSESFRRPSEPSVLPSSRGLHRAAQRHTAPYWYVFGSFIDYGSVQAKVLQASLRADSREKPAGGRVTLTCSVDASADWRYYWFRKQTSEYSKSFMIQSGIAEQNITVSEDEEEEEIQLFSQRTATQLRVKSHPAREKIFYGPWDDIRTGPQQAGTPSEKMRDAVITTKNQRSGPKPGSNTPSKAAKITQNPSWIKIFIGERVSLTCVISDGDCTEWEYEWKTTSSEKPVKSTEDWVFYASVSSDGDYWCRGKQKMDSHPTTWSYPIRFTVLCKATKPKATLNVDLFHWNGDWTLTCYVNTSPSTWKYFWYMDEIPSEVMPREDATVSNNQIVVSQRGLYWCRGGRGEPVYYTEFSEPLKVGTNPTEESESAADPTPPTSVTRPPCEKVEPLVKNKRPTRIQTVLTVILPKVQKKEEWPKHLPSFEITKTFFSFIKTYPGDDHMTWTQHRQNGSTLS
ncbi:hypothetical protein CCH79_00020501, partial [Gambusia affinis]